MMDGKSLPITEDKQNALRQLFPEVFSEGKIDWEKLKATLGEDITFSNERYVLNWAGKSDAFKVLQAPTTKTLIPAKDESINFDETENIFIEGENLEVLKVLQKSYFGKVKMIYIDPPYNTGNDSFIYPDKFAETKEEYQKRVGDKDEEGYMTKDGMFKKNSKENGQYHSNWLNMMMPRLYLAKNLLRQDGIIFVSIDDNEVHNLRLLMNEVFGEENFVAKFDWRKKTGANDAKDIAIITETILLFAKNHTATIENDIWERDENSINQQRFRLIDEFVDIRGKYYYDTLDRGGLQYSDSMNFGIQAPDGGMIFPNGRSTFVNDGWIWKWGKSKVKWGLENKFLEFIKSDKSEGSDFTIKYKVYQNVDNEGNIRQKSGRAYTNLITEPINQQGNADFANLFEGKTYFSNPKPIGLIQYFLRTNNNKSDLILDFFSGSATTAHAVMDLNKEDGGNRKYICVQLPELCDEKSEAHKAGYKTIADIAKERIRRVIAKINEEKETLGKETAILMEKVAELQQQIEELKKNQPASIFNDGKQSPEIEKLIKQQETARDKANENIEKMDKIDQCDKGFKVLKLNDSNFKQWLQINGKDAKALEEQMKLFIDPVAENATIENMVYELLLKSGKDLNSKIEHATNYFKINENELVFMLEKATQEIIDAVLKEKPLKVVALDKLFKGNDQLKTNTVLQMKDAGVEFKTI